MEGQVKSGASLVGKWSMPDLIQGKSAYEIAVMHGFEGTEEEWLASLKGEKGDQGTLDVVTYMGGQHTGAVEETNTLTFDAGKGIGLRVEDGKVLMGIDETTFPEDLKGSGGSGLPEVTEAENGKILMVVGGKWENVEFPAGTQYESVTATIPASSWNDNGSMIHAVWYGLQQNVDGCDIDVSLAASSAKEQFEEAARCGVYCSSATGTELVFTALYDRPTIDLTFDIRITKPTTLAYSVDEASMTLTIVEGYDG
jgi:hypothetical protein